MAYRPSFVIDEALGLQYKGLSKDEREIYDWEFQDFNMMADKYENVGKRAPYNIFRRAFRIFTNTWEHIMLIVVSSTSGQICASITPPEQKMDPSWREQTSISFIENFAFVQTYGVNSETVQSITAETCTDWEEFLKSDVRIIEYFKLGRPLIYGIFLDEQPVKYPKKYNLESKFEECGEFKFMATKLFGGKEYGLTRKLTFYLVCLTLPLGQIFCPATLTRKT